MSIYVWRMNFKSNCWYNYLFVKKTYENRQLKPFWLLFYIIKCCNLCRHFTWSTICLDISRKIPCLRIYIPFSPCVIIRDQLVSSPAISTFDGSAGAAVPLRHACHHQEDEEDHEVLTIPDNVPALPPTTTVLHIMAVLLGCNYSGLAYLACLAPHSWLPAIFQPK